MSEEVPPGILRLDMGKPRRSSGASVEFRSHPDVVEPISPDRLSVSFAPPSSTTPQTDHSTPRSTPSMEKVQFHTDDDDDEDYSASACVIMQRRQSSRRKSRRHQGGRRPSSPLFSPDFDSGHSGSRRRSSVFTTSSGDTAVSMGMEEVTQEQIYENLRLHKEVLSNVKHQPWSIQRKLRLVRQAKAYVKQHEGELQQRLAQGKTTRDVLARFNIILVKRWQYLKRELANFMNLLIPWELRIKEIESHFGSVVASYFTFLRWLFWVNLVIAVLLIAFVAIPEVLTADPRKAGERKEMLPEEREKATDLATLWDFEGTLRYSPFFYGYYTNQDTHGTGYRLPFAYFMTGLAVYIYSFVAILRRMAKNSRMSKLSEKEDECVFTWKLFTGWDYMIGNAETAHNRVASIILGFKEALVEEAEKKKDARNWQIIGLRVLVNLTVLALLASSAYAVVEVVKRSTHVEHDANWWRQNEITIVLTSITFIFPIIFEVLGLFECFHPRKQLRLQLARIMVLNMLNLYTLIFALFGKISLMTTELENWKPNTTTLSPVTEAQQSKWSPSTEEQMNTTAILTMIATSIASTPQVTENILETVRDSSTANTTMSVLVTEQAVNKFSTVAINNISSIGENSSLPLPLPLPTLQESSSLTITEIKSTEHSEEPEAEIVSSSLKYDLTSGIASTTFDYDDSQQYEEEWEYDQQKIRGKRDAESTTIRETDESAYDSIGIETTVTEISIWNNEQEEGSSLSTTTVETTHSESKLPLLETETKYLESFSYQSAVTESQLSTQESILDASELSVETEQQFQSVTGHTDMLTMDNSDLSETPPFSIHWQPTTTSTMHITGETLDAQSTVPTSELFPADQMDPKNRIKLRRLCWETMFGQELVKLTVMDLVVTVTSTLIMDFIRALFVRFANGCWCWDLEKQFPQYGDFKIAENILHLVNNQGMVWMGMFFSPGLPILNLAKLIVLMYLRSWAVLTCNVPHEVVFRASRSNNFYFALLLTMLFLCVLPVGYTIVWIKPSWHCGPFSNYRRIYHIFTKSLQQALPSSLHRALDYIASPGTVIPLLLLLILVIYYLLSLTGALREANNDLKIQLRRERTEERRKMFQLVHRRRRGGSGADSSDMPYKHWRSILPSVPSKTENATLGNGNVKNEANRNELLTKIVKKALRKSSATSDEESLPIVEGIEQQDLIQEKLKTNKAKSRTQESIQEIPTVSVHHHNNKRQRHKSSSNSSNNREREDSITSAWSEKIPEIRISKTDSTEYIQQQAEPQCPVKTSSNDNAVKAEVIEPVHISAKPSTSTCISGLHISSDDTLDKRTLAKSLMTDCSVTNKNDVDSHELVHLGREKANRKEQNPKQTSIS